MDSTDSEKELRVERGAGAEEGIYLHGRLTT